MTLPMLPSSASLPSASATSIKLRLWRLRCTVLAVCGALGACAVGPDYRRPAVVADAPLAASFKEGPPSTAPSTARNPADTAATATAWNVAQPKDDVERGQWWLVFGDTQLNALEDQVLGANQSVVLADAQFRQFIAQYDSAVAAQFPTVNLSASERRSGPSNSTAALAASGLGVSAAPSSRAAAEKSYSAALGLSWEIDLWGALRRNSEARQATAFASKADFVNALLSAQSTLADTYFKLRLVDAQKVLLQQTLDAYQRSLDLTRNRYNGGVAARADLVQADTQYKTTLVQAIDLDVQRSQYEHAIAVLLGKSPSDFSIAPAPLPLDRPGLPSVPSAGLPSELLERRPDIAAAERRMISANASIGVAKAAYFPSLSLSASDGYTSSSLANWISAPNRIWSFGPALAVTLFDAGARNAATRQASAAYDASVATYRQTVLNGFKEVEDALAQLRIYEREADAQYDALLAARESLTLVTNQYKAGIVSYLNVIAAQTTALASERNFADLIGNRLSTTITLIKALGGGWNTADLSLAAQR